MADYPNIPNLESMPNELLLTIFEKTKSSDLVNLLNVNHRFRNLIKAHAWTKLFLIVDYTKMSMEFIETRLQHAASFGILVVANLTNGSQVQDFIANISEHKSKIHMIVLMNCTFQIPELNDLLMPFIGIKTILFNGTMIHPYVPVEGGDALIVPAFAKLKYLTFKSYHNLPQLSYPHAIFGALTNLDRIDAVRMENFQIVVQQKNLKQLVIFMSRVPNDFWSPAIQQAIKFQLKLFHYVGVALGDRSFEPELITFLRSQRALQYLCLCSCGSEEINAVISHTYLTQFVAVLVDRPTFGEITGINQSVKTLFLCCYDPAVLKNVEIMANPFRGVITMALHFFMMNAGAPEDCQILRFTELKSIVDFSLVRIPTSLLKIIEVEMLTQVGIIPSNTYQDRKDVQNFIKYHKKVKVAELDDQLEEEDFKLMLQEWTQLESLTVSCYFSFFDFEVFSAFNLGYIERIAKIILEHGRSVTSLKFRKIPLVYHEIIKDLFQPDFEATNKPPMVVQIEK